MTESPVRGPLKHTLQQIADRILSDTDGDISLVCLRLDNGIYRVEAYAGDFPAEEILNLDFRAGEGGTGGIVAETGKPQLGRAGAGSGEYLPSDAGTPGRDHHGGENPDRAGR